MIHIEIYYTIELLLFNIIHWPMLNKINSMNNLTDYFFVRKRSYITPSSSTNSTIESNKGKQLITCIGFLKYEI